MKFITSALLVTLSIASQSIEAFAPTRSLSRTDQTTALRMVTGKAMQCRPIGIGSATPKTSISNVDLESIVETSDEWINTRTGISNRHVLLADETLRSLGTQASKNALDMAGIDPEDIDIVICCTSSPDDLFGDATVIASELGCTRHTVAFDLTAACSGFLFGAFTAGQFLTNGSMKNALVVGSDALSRWVDWDDRNTCILFGDGAGAMVLTNQDTDAPGLLGYSAHSNGNGYEDLNCRIDNEEKEVSTPGEPTVIASGRYGKLAMNGQEVYKFATREVPKVIKEALEAAEMTVDDVDHLLLHQANIRIMDTVAKKLGIPKEKLITNLSEYGNTSAASIPLAFDEAVRSGRVKKGDVIAMSGFGAGLSWGSVIMRWG